MTHPSPLAASSTRFEPPVMPYALGDAEPAASLIAAHAPVAFEYAALRRSAGLLDMPHRATVEVTGADRTAFLQRMITQDIIGKPVPIGPLACRDSFWCNRKGRIDADMRLILLEESILIDVDVHAAQRLVDTLGAFVIADDCELTLASDRWHRLGLHGPASRSLLESCGELLAGDPAAVGHATRWAIRTPDSVIEVIADHRPLTGEVGYELTVPTFHAEALTTALFAAAGWGDHNPYEPTEPSEDGMPDVRLRPIGWHAFNTARIEAGVPLYYLDFGPEHLPHESGIVDRRVRFDKGCYLGQEIVARLQALGHPKQKIVSLDLSIEGVPAAETPQPTQGAAVLADVEDARETVGVVTSSSISPMLGGRPICFAMVRWQHAQPGQRVSVTADGDILDGVVRERLAYWPANG